jgi:integrase
MKSHSVTRQVTAPVTLTASKVGKVTPGNAVREVRDAVCPGLRLAVQPTGVRSWVVRYWLNKRHGKVTLGKWPAMGLATARIKARAVLDKVSLGIDPRQQAADTFEAAVADYHARHTAKLRATTRQYVTRELAVASKYWRGRKLVSITRRDVIAITDEVEKRGGSARMTMLKTLSAFFRWCMSRDLIGASPSVGVKRDKYVARERTLTDDELRAVWNAAERQGAAWGALVKLLALTAMRRNEAAKLQWSEIIEDAIELPPERTKTATRLNVPITPAVRKLLDTLPRTGPYVFKGKNALHVSGTTEDMLDVKLATPWVLHDLRRTVASGMQKLGVPHEVIDAALGHKVRGVSGVYMKHDYAAEVAAAFEKWSNHVATLTA